MMRPGNFVGRMRGAVRGTLAAATMLAVLHAATPASALTAPEDPFSTWTLVSESTLKDSRGGFSVKTPIGTLEFDFGVTVKSAVKSVAHDFVMQTVFTFNDNGRVNSATTTSGSLPEGTNVSTGSDQSSSHSSSPSHGGVTVAVSNPTMKIVQKVAKDHSVTLSAAVSESGLSIEQSAVADLAFKNFSHISGALKTKSMISNIARDVGAMTAR